MFKYAIAILIPFVSFAASVITKPYDQLDKNDNVVTNVNFSGLTTPSEVTNIAQYVASSGASTTDLVARASADSAYLLATNTYNITTQKLDRVNGTSTNQTLYSATVTNKLAFGTAYSSALAIGEIAWDPNWMTFRGGIGGVDEGQFFQESYIYGKNASGQIITNGMVVRFSGVVGNSGKCEFTLAKADPAVRPATTLGVATQNILPNGFGMITWFGNVSAVDTTGALYGETGWTNNMIVYLSTNTPGFLTRYEPQAPYPRISMGAVINRHANAGTILVRPTWGMKLTDADDVDGTPLTASGQMLVWDAVRGVFDFTDNINRYTTTNQTLSWLGGYLPLASWTGWLGTNTYVKVESDPAAMDALAQYSATNRVTRWYESPTNWMVSTGSNVVYGVNVRPLMQWHFDGSADALPLPYPLDEFSGGGWLAQHIWDDPTAVAITWSDGVDNWYLLVTPTIPLASTSFCLYNITTDARTNVYYSGVGLTTNVAAYYLGSAPPLTSETWSYTDMANWMATGNAGQTWVTNITASLRADIDDALLEAYQAKSQINNHETVAADPHPGKYVKLTDGTATNLAIVGGNVSGDPLIGANAVTQHVAQSIAAPYTAWTGTVTPADGTATVAIAHGNMPVLVADAPCVLTLDPTGYGTAGVSRVSLSYYPGTNSFTFATNIINYAETPTVDTNGWNTLLIRRVSNSDWKGVGL